MMTRRTLLATSVGSLLAAGTVPRVSAAQNGDEPGFFLSALTGGGEVPPVDTDADGGAVFATDENGTELQYALGVREIENVTQAHIHLGSVGENGPIVAWLYPAPDVREPDPIDGRFDGVLASDVVTADDLVGPLEGEPLSALLDEMAARSAYVNVHTQQHPAGEIRGQIIELADVADAVELWQRAARTETEPLPV